MTFPAPPTDEQFLLQFIQAHDVACPVCKYNLRALTVPRCPECGRALKLTVGTIEPYLTAWITLVVAAFASTGIAFLLDAYALCKGVHFLNAGEDAAFFSFNLSIPLALAAIFLRRAFLRFSGLIQWPLAVAVLFLTLAQIAAFLLIMQ
jgi:hypothetical protein